MNWKDVTLEQFLQLKELINIEDDTERLLSISELLLGEKVSELPVAEYTKRIKELDFLKTEIPTNQIVNKITINGNTYCIDAVIGRITTAQYIDYDNYIKKDESYDKILSVFFIPNNHKYNDGYDIEEVLKDIRQLPITVVVSECFFFERQLRQFYKTFQSSLIHQVKRQKIDKKVKKSLIELIRSYPLQHSSVSYPTYSSSVK